MIEPSTEQVLAIRQEWDEGKLDTRGWANALDCSLETVRRIGRRDTYRKVGRPTSTAARPLPPAQAPKGEPTADEIARSLARLQRLTEEQPEGPEAARQALEGLREQGE